MGKGAFGAAVLYRKKDDGLMVVIKVFLVVMKVFLAIKIFLLVIKVSFLVVKVSCW